MDSTTRLALAIRKGQKTRSPFVYGIWQAAETADANLSQVLIPGAALDGGDMIARFVPKGAHVTGLTTTSTVLMVGSPLCIIAVVVGNISVAVV